MTNQVSQARYRPILVGSNSSASDLPIPLQHAVVHGLDAGGSGPDGASSYFDRASADSLDLKYALGGGRSGGPSLDEMATLSGIPGKMGADGAAVAGLWLDGRHRRILDYNLSDGLTTYLLWLRVARFRGVFSSFEYDLEQERVRELLQNEAERPNGAYAKAYPSEWRRRANTHDAQYATAATSSAARPFVMTNGR